VTVGGLQKHMNIPVKLFVKDEVRRFAFSGSTFKELYEECSKLTNLPASTLQYYDDEGDYVTFSADSELQYALSLLKEPKILRVRAIVPEQPVVASVQNPPEVEWKRYGRHKAERKEYKAERKEYKAESKEYKAERKEFKKQKHVKDLDARFVSHVNFEDGCKVAPGLSFVKVWTLRNNGASRWPEGTSIMRVDRANDLNATFITPYTGNLPAPDAEVNVSVKMDTPVLPGEYSAYFKMLSPEGKKFGQRIRCQVVVSNANQPVAEKDVYQLEQHRSN